ncbi:MAG: two-component regulator propeller domain-containing protein [Anaeromyxobacter sp.]
MPRVGPRQLLGAILLSVLPLVAAATAPLAFERVGVGDGLPSETATAVLRDRDGFVWVGTRDGLALYDGYGMRVFQHDADDPESLPSNGIRALHEDAAGRLWVATNGGGLALLHRGTWRFRTFRHDEAHADSLSNDTVYAIEASRDGRLWVGTHAGLDLLDPAAGTFQHVLRGDGPAPRFGQVMVVTEDPGGRVWVGSYGSGLALRDAAGAWTFHRHEPGRPDSLASDDVFAVALDGKGRAWLGTHDGLDRWEGHPGSFVHVDLAPTGPPKVLVTSIVFGEGGELWVGTMGRGLIELGPGGDGPVVAHLPSAASATALPSDQVVGLAVDGHELWVATYGGGLAHARTGRALPLAPARPAPAPGTKGGAAGADPAQDDLLAVLEAPDGTVWAASFGGGLLEYPPGKAPVRHLYERGTKGSGMLHVRRGAKGRLWLGAMDRLWRYDPGSGKVEVLRNDPADPASLPAGYVTVTLGDRAGRKWVGTGGNGLVRLDEDGHRKVVARFAPDVPPPARLADGYVTALLEDARGTIWVGTRQGLHALDPEKGTVTAVPVGRDRRRSLASGAVNCLFADAHGGLWVGTGAGLVRMDASSGPGDLRFEHFTSREGLVDDDVTAVVEDDDGSLWVATRSGLSRFDPATVTFVSFDAADVLGSIEFNPGAAARGRTNLIFGTRRGLLEIPRGTAFPRRSPSRVALTSIRTADGEVAAPVPVWRLGALSVPYGRWLSVEMAVLDYRASHRHRYAYRLRDGEPWVELGARREVTFAGLAPGNYRLSVRARDARGAYSVAEPTLALTIVPPLWMTWPFRVAALVALVALATSIHLGRLRGLRRRNAALEALREEREAAYERLRQLTIHLEAVREDERRWIARELHDEMGQELTAAKINLQLLGRTPQPALPGAFGAPFTPQGVADTVQLLDRLIARVRNLSLDLRPPLLDDRGLRPALEGWLEAVGKRSGMSTRLAVEGEIGRLAPEIEIAGFRVVQEAVTNALRHAHARALEVALSRENGTLRLAVKDDGAGFDVEDALARSAGGDHIGLLGMRERVEMMGGGLEIASAVGAGTEVRAWLPLEGRT